MLLVLVSGGKPARADEIWRWQDASGGTHFGATPPPGVKATLVAPGPTNRAQPQATPAAPTSPGPAKPKKPTEDTSIEARNACDDARFSLAVLGESRPVYRDDQGALRVKRPPRQGDPYEGTRQYLSDEERASETARYREQMEHACAGFPDLQDPQKTQEELYRAENCELAKAELSRLSNPELNAAETDLQSAQQQYQRWCTGATQ